MRLSLHRALILSAAFLPGLIIAQTNYTPSTSQTNYTPYTFSADNELGIPLIGSQNGTGGNAGFFHPSAVVSDSRGNIYVADTSNNTIRMIALDDTVSTFAGLAGATGSVDGTGSTARFYTPAGLAIDASDTLDVSDTGNDEIRKIPMIGANAGMVTTFAGLAGSSGFADGTGSAARFLSPVGIAVDLKGNAYVCDVGNNTVREITPSGEVTTVAGVGMMPSAGSTDVTGVSARFNLPNSTVVDSSGVMFHVADSANHVVRKISPNGLTATLAGGAGLRRQRGWSGVSGAIQFSNRRGRGERLDRLAMLLGSMPNLSPSRPLRVKVGIACETDSRC